MVLLHPFLLVACLGDDAPDPPATGGDPATTDTAAPVTDTASDTATDTAPPEDQDCTVRFALLQKDAYSDLDGRNQPLWPPHTTTAVEFICLGANWDYETLSNHGTDYTELASNGDFWLEVVDTSDELPVSRTTLDALRAAFLDCNCEAAGDYVSLSAITDPGVQDLLDALADFTNTHLSCVDGTMGKDVAAWLEDGDIESVLGKIQQCNLGGLDWGDGFRAAVEAIGGAPEVLHTANNDAILQAEWYAAWEATGVVGTCDGSAAVCRDTTWFNGGY